MLYQLVPGVVRDIPVRASGERSQRSFDLLVAISFALRSCYRRVLLRSKMGRTQPVHKLHHSTLMESPDCDLQTRACSFFASPLTIKRYCGVSETGC